MRAIVLWGIFIPAMIIGISCAKSDSPTAPSGALKNQETGMPAKADNHYLWSFSLVYADPANNRYEVVPAREVADHYNVLKWLEGGPCTNCVSITKTKKLINNNLLVTVQVKHPFPASAANFTGFDVRGIAMFKGTQSFPVAGYKTSSSLKGEAELINPDGFTTLYNPTTGGKGPGGLQGYIKGKMSAGLPDSTLNGYMMFNSPGSDNTRNYLLAGASVTNDFEIKLPTGPFVFGYAIDGSWVKPDVTPVNDPNTDFPDNANCSEPWKVSVSEDAATSTLTNQGGKTTLDIKVYDHQGKDSYQTPTVECPDFFAGTLPATFSQTVDNYDEWTVDVPNTSLAKAGKYKVLVAVIDNDNTGSPAWLNIATYQVITIQVTPQTSLAGWADTFGGPNEDEALASVTDASGNVYVTGFFNGTVDFDPGSGVKNLTSNGSGTAGDAFLAKYDASGALVWAESWGDKGMDTGVHLALNGTNLFVYGFSREQSISIRDPEAIFTLRQVFPIFISACSTPTATISGQKRGVRRTQMV